MKKLVAAEGQQTALMKKLVDLQDEQMRKQDRHELLIEQLAETQRELVHFLVGTPPIRPGAKLVDLNPKKAKGD